MRRGDLVVHRQRDVHPELQYGIILGVENMGDVQVPKSWVPLYTVVWNDGRVLEHAGGNLSRVRIHETG